MKKFCSFLFFLHFANSYSQTIGLQQHLAGTLDEGYVLFAPNNSTTTYLINKCGQQVKTWPNTYRPGQSCYILPDGTLLRTGNVNNATFTAGGTGGIIQKIDWNGNVNWSYSVSDATKCQHHDVKAMPNGNILIIAWELKTNTQAIAAGRNPTQVPSTLWSEQIIEVQPTGINGGTIVWEWHLWDHLVQDFDATKTNFGVVAANPKLLNINYNSSATQPDWIHLNSIDYNPILDQILLSLHNLDEVWIIDHSTTTSQAASHSGGNSGNGGDIIYRWGNPASYNNGTTTDQKLYGQHNARWIEAGLPFENQIMIFNNGIGRPGGNYSTVEIINPPVNAFNYTSTLPYLPLTTSWNYNYGNPNNLYSQNISGAQQLSNGNVLVCSGGNGTFTEATTTGSIVWKYINPVNNSGVINQGANPTQNAVFRSVFYPTNYSGFSAQNLTTGNTIENSNIVSANCNLILNSSLFAVNKNEITVYPNPASNFIAINLKAALPSNCDVQLLDITGKIIQTAQIIKDNSSAKLDVNAVSNGLYFILLTTQNESIAFKIVIQK